MAKLSTDSRQRPALFSLNSANIYACVFQTFAPIPASPCRAAHPHSQLKDQSSLSHRLARQLSGEIQIYN